MPFTLLHLNQLIRPAANPQLRGRLYKKNFVGSHMENYDSMLVLSHFKGHPMGGFGGALKNISIGLASSHGKAYIHGVGVPENFWSSDHDSFLESMADAAQSVVNYFPGKIAYINVMKNMSVDCDCFPFSTDSSSSPSSSMISTAATSVHPCSFIVSQCAFVVLRAPS